LNIRRDDRVTGAVHVTGDCEKFEYSVQSNGTNGAEPVIET